MLAKKYHFPYEVIRSLATVKGNRGKMGVYAICVLDVEYPINNIELLLEQLGGMKDKIKNELDKRPPQVRENRGKVEEIIRQITADLFKDLKLRIVVENGYKEWFYYDEEGLYAFDLTTIKKIGHIASQAYLVSHFVYKGMEIDLTEVCPEYWRGKWSIVKSSL